MKYRNKSNGIEDTLWRNDRNGKKPKVERRRIGNQRCPTMTEYYRGLPGVNSSVPRRDCFN